MKLTSIVKNIISESNSNINSLERELKKKIHPRIYVQNSYISLPFMNDNEFKKIQPEIESMLSRYNLQIVNVIERDPEPYEHSGYIRIVFK